MLNEVIGEGELLAILAVSKVTLWTWRRQGLPAKSEGRAGIENQYDPAAVLKWLEGSVHAIDARTGRDRVHRLRARVQAAQPAAIAAAQNDVQARVQEVIGVVFANALIPACAMMVGRRG